MGFSTSGAAAILFVGLLIAVGMVVPAIESAHDRQSEAMDARDDRALDVRNTVVGVDATVETDGAGNESLVVTAANDGTTTLSVPDTTLLVDGVHERPNETRVVDDNETWSDDERSTYQPGETLEFVLDDPDADRVKVVTGLGVGGTAEVADGG